MLYVRLTYVAAEVRLIREDLRRVDSQLPIRCLDSMVAY